MIKVYQIQMSNADIHIINTDGEYTPKIQAFFDRSFESTFKAENFKYYTHVANVDVDGFEQAFRVMNLWEDDENFERLELLERCASMSVGDIVADHNGDLYRVASFGFTLLEKANA